MSDTSLVHVELDLTEAGLLRDAFNQVMSDRRVDNKTKHDWMNLYVAILNQIKTQQPCF